MKATGFIITGLVTVGVAAAIVAGLFKNKAVLDAGKVVVDRSEIPVNVNTYTVKKQSISQTFELPGNMIINDESKIASEISGRLATFNLQIGSVVKKGQVVGTIDMQETQLKLKAVKLNIAKLEEDLERSKKLVAANATNANEVIEVQYQLDAKKIEAEQLEFQISKAKIIAPLSGMITAKSAVAGEFVSTGATLATIVQNTGFKASVSVQESRITEVQMGEPVEVFTSLFPGQVFNGKVSYIAPQGDVNHNYKVEIALGAEASKTLKAGMYIQVRFNINDKTVEKLLIPKAALAEGMSNPYVFIAANNKAKKRNVVLGEVYGDNVEVVSGLNVGEKIITTGIINVFENSNLKIVNE